MQTEARKGELELHIFLEFASRVGLSIVPSTVEKRSPPEPDILCQLASGEFVAFELAEACAPEFAAAMSKSVRNNVASAEGQDVSAETVRNKLTKRYETTHPVELLLYTNGRTALRDSDIVFDVGPALSLGLGQFRRIWFMGDSVQQLAGST
jgi:hypothetical protein